MHVRAPPCWRQAVVAAAALLSSAHFAPRPVARTLAPVLFASTARHLQAPPHQSPRKCESFRRSLVSALLASQQHDMLRLQQQPCSGAAAQQAQAVARLPTATRRHRLSVTAAASPTTGADNGRPTGPGAKKVLVVGGGWAGFGAVKHLAEQVGGQQVCPLGCFTSAAAARHVALLSVCQGTLLPLGCQSLGRDVGTLLSAADRDLRPSPSLATPAACPDVPPPHRPLLRRAGLQRDAAGCRREPRRPERCVLVTQPHSPPAFEVASVAMPCISAAHKTRVPALTVVLVTPARPLLQPVGVRRRAAQWRRVSRAFGTRCVTAAGGSAGGQAAAG